VAAEQVTAVQSVLRPRRFTGQLVPRRSTRLAFERTGKIEHLTADDGHAVQQDAMLATLDTAQLAARRAELTAEQAVAQARFAELRAGPRRQTIAAAQARVAERAANLRFWDREILRFEGLVAEEHATMKELDDARTQRTMAAAQLDAARQERDELEAGTRAEQVDAQRARVERIRAAIERIDVDLDKSRLRAPFAGAIARRWVDEGTVVQNGEPVFELIEHDVLEARIGLPAQMVSQIKVGEERSLRVGSTTVTGRVTAMLPQVDALTRTVTAVLTVDDAVRQGLRPYRMVELELAEPMGMDAYAVPFDALVKGERGLWAVYALVPMSADRSPQVQPFHVVQRRDVEVLYTDAKTAYVRGVLRPGEAIVADGPHRVVPGQRVRAVATAAGRE
jgi:RND family efflux transporter MFP subunit